MVFSLTPPTDPGGTWTEAVLCSFTGINGDGDGPEPGVVIGKGGVLYGTTVGGGTSNYGTVFSLTPPSSPGGAWTKTILYSFAGPPSDGYDGDGVVIGGGGVLYGANAYGGAAPCSSFATGCGNVFSLTPPMIPGGAWTETVLYNFSGIPDGAEPVGVAIGDGGVLYGTTAFGGNSLCEGNLGCGSVFELMPPTAPGGSWTETLLHSFNPGNGSDGEDPVGGVAIGSGGVLYGTTQIGGTMAFGTVFSLAPPASPAGAWTETILHNFTRNSNGGADPEALVIGGGALYGTTSGNRVDAGTVFALKP